MVKLSFDIVRNHREKNLMVGVMKMVTYIGSIAEPVTFVSPKTKNEEVDRIFKENDDLEGIVVVENDIPKGILMKAHFYEKIGTRFGFDLYMGRSAELVMHHSPLIVDHSTVLTEVSTRAMNREHKHLYDYVIVTHHDKFFGVVTIQNLLLKFAEIQADLARFMNPLTGLPGNKMIDDKIQESITLPQYSILYIDLDNFKTYNDTYGFKMGDKLIQATANIISSHIKQNSFVGHIGGDDYIAILFNYDFEAVCEAIIHDFNQAVKGFYHPADWKQKYVIAKNRKGKIEQFSLVSISIAVVTNRQQTFRSIEEVGEVSARLKKECKLHESSCYRAYYKKAITS